MDSAEPLPDWTIAASSTSTPRRGGVIGSVVSSALVPVQALVGEFVATFKEFPPRQKPSSFSVDQIMETLQSRKVADNLVPLADVPIEPVDRFKM